MLYVVFKDVIPLLRGKRNGHGGLSESDRNVLAQARQDSFEIHKLRERVHDLAGDLSKLMGRFEERR